MKKLLIVTQKVDADDQLLGFFVEWLRLLAGKCERLTILCLQKGRYDLPDNVEVVGLGKDLGRPKVIWLWNFYNNIWRLRGRYDAVFVHMNPIWVVVGGWLWHLMDKRVLLWYTHKAVTVKLRLAAAWADTILTASPESFRLRSSKVVVTGHGIDTGLFRPDPSKRPADGRLHLLTVGRIAPSKNYETIVEAAKLLAGKSVAYKLTVIGKPALERDREYETKIRGKIRELGLEGHFKFLGKITNRDLTPYYQSHDIFIHPSKTGSVDKVSLEAMACGMQILSSNDSARAYLPQELIFDENNAQELAEKIMAIAGKTADPKLREYVIEHHSLPKLADKIISLLDQNRNASPRHDRAVARPIILTGYSYVFPQIYNVLRFYPHPEELAAIVPAEWRSREGKLVFKPQLPSEMQVNYCRAFNLKRYRFGASALKGFMPGFLCQLLSMRRHSGTDPKLVFNAVEANLLYTLYTAVSAKLVGAKHVFYTWENVPYEKKTGPLKRLYFKTLLKAVVTLSDCAICGNKKAEAIIQRLGRIRTEVFPHSGIDTERFSPQAGAAYRKGLEDKIVLVFAGGLDKRKGVDVLIQAFAGALEQVPRLHLIFSGLGHMEGRLKQYVVAHKLEDSVTFVGWTPHERMHQVYASGDIFVYPSIPWGRWEEQFGNSMAEALACGKPVIASRTGSIDEVVLDGQTGILIESGNVSQLTGAIVKLANNADLRQSMGQAGRRHVVNNFSLEVISNKFYQFFHSF